MRRARIQIKPNIAKASKQVPAPAVPTPHSDAVSTFPAPPLSDTVPTPIPEKYTEEYSEPDRISEDVIVKNRISPPDDDAPSESMKSLHVDTSRTHQNRVHFIDDVIDIEHNRNHEEEELNTTRHQNNIQMRSPTSNQASNPFTGSSARLITPRSRNVSMCEDETIFQPKPTRDKRRFTGKEELDTKTWKMSDLARWNPKNEITNFKRERRSSTSSTVITKSEIGDNDAPTPRINAPQVKIGADGRLVIDETSLVVQSAQISHESVWETVEEGRMGSKITSMSFRNRIFRKPNSWSERETDLFYEVLQCTGQDFGLMHHYLPQRSRPELKTKYNREEKLNWGRLLNAISHPVRLDGSLHERIAKIMAEIEGEAQQKKARTEYEKAEERRIREQNRLQKANERIEERLKKQEARELVRQAKELEKDARIAAKINYKITEKEAEGSDTRMMENAEKEFGVTETAAEKEAKAKEKSDAKLMAMEARRIALEARNIIKETRKAEKAKKLEARQQAESYNLEREAERIIRRLIQESQREERRLAQEMKRKNPEKRRYKKAASVVDEGAPTKLAAEEAGPNASGGDSGDTTSASAETSSSVTSSDEDAVGKETARREKKRMKETRRNLEPRKTVLNKKPVYVSPHDAKYAQQSVSRAVEMVLKANGNMFDSADEQDEFTAPDSMDTSTTFPADQCVPEPAPAAPKSAEQEQESECVPLSVTEVIEEYIRDRSKTPVEARQTAEKEVNKLKKGKREELSKDEIVTDEPPRKIAKVEGGIESDSMNADDTFDVVTHDVEATTAINGPSTSSISAVVPALPGTSVTAAPAGPSSVPVAIQDRQTVRRTVKKPVTWIKKK